MFVASRSKNNLYTFSSLEVKHPLLYGWLRRTVYLSDNALTALLYDVPRCGLSWCGHGGGPGGEKILNTAPAPEVEPPNCSQPQPRPPTLSAAVCCHQMQTDARCGASPLHTLCYIVIGNLTPTTHLSAETPRNFMH